MEDLVGKKLQVYNLPTDLDEDTLFKKVERHFRKCSGEVKSVNIVTENGMPVGEVTFRKFDSIKSVFSKPIISHKLEGSGITSQPLSIVISQPPPKKFTTCCGRIFFLLEKEYVSLGFNDIALVSFFKSKNCKFVYKRNNSGFFVKIYGKELSGELKPEILPFKLVPLLKTKNKKLLDLSKSTASVLKVRKVKVIKHKQSNIVTRFLNIENNRNTQVYQMFLEKDDFKQLKLNKSLTKKIANETGTKLKISTILLSSKGERVGMNGRIKNFGKALLTNDMGILFENDVDDVDFVFETFCDEEKKKNNKPKYFFFFILKIFFEEKIQLLSALEKCKNHLWWGFQGYDYYIERKNRFYLFHNFPDDGMIHFTRINGPGRKYTFKEIEKREESSIKIKWPLYESDNSVENEDIAYYPLCRGYLHTGNEASLIKCFDAIAEVILKEKEKFEYNDIMKLSFFVNLGSSALSGNFFNDPAYKTDNGVVSPLSFFALSLMKYRYSDRKTSSFLTEKFVYTNELNEEKVKNFQENLIENGFVKKNEKVEYTLICLDRATCTQYRITLREGGEHNNGNFEFVSLTKYSKSFLSLMTYENKAIKNFDQFELNFKSCASYKINQLTENERTIVNILCSKKCSIVNLYKIALIQNNLVDITFYTDYVTKKEVVFRNEKNGLKFRFLSYSKVINIGGSKNWKWEMGTKSRSDVFKKNTFKDKIVVRKETKKDIQEISISVFCEDLEKLLNDRSIFNVKKDSHKQEESIYLETLKRYKKEVSEKVMEIHKTITKLLRKKMLYQKL